LAPAAQQWFGINAVQHLHLGWMLIPLSQHFAFVSPPMLIIVFFIFILLPLLLLLRLKRFPVRREKVWFGGRQPDSVARAATTALTFSNALRTFYSFIYRPTHQVDQEFSGKDYFTKKVHFQQRVSLFFNRYLFQPLLKAFDCLSKNIQKLQSGDINFYNAIILLVLILALVSVLL
jgi:hydrogenase-4 component B